MTYEIAFIVILDQENPLMPTRITHVKVNPSYKDIERLNEMSKAIDSENCKVINLTWSDFLRLKTFMDKAV